MPGQGDCAVRFAPDDPELPGPLPTNHDPASRNCLSTPQELVSLVAAQEMPPPVAVFGGVAERLCQQTSADTQLFVFGVEGAHVPIHGLVIPNGQDDRDNPFLVAQGEDPERPDF